MRKTVSAVRRVLSEVFWIGLTAAILFAGVSAFQSLKSNRTVVEAAPVERPVTVVETQAGSAWTAPLPIRGEGFVKPLRSIAVAPLTGGTITYLHPAIEDDRGTFSEGEVLVRLDDSTERANLRQTEANIAAAEATVKLETSSLDRVRALFDRGAATRQDLDTAEARHADALARLDGLEAARQATEVAIENKIVRAPFSGAILTKLAEVGSVVAGGQAVAEAFTNDRLVIDVNLTEAEAALIPGLFDGAEAHAEISMTFAGSRYIADGLVTSVAAAIDPRTRTLSVRVALEPGAKLRPADGAGHIAGTPPALVNAFAQVTIDGIIAPDIYKVPSTALHEETVYLLSDGQLRIAPARPVHVDGEATFAEVRDVPEGARLVLSTIAAPVDGMALTDLASANGEAVDVARNGEE